jgi:hypothetical protein
MRLLHYGRLDHLVHTVVLARVVDRFAAGPQSLHDLDLLAHLLVSHLFGVEHAVILGGAIVEAGDQVDTDAPTRHLVERRERLGRQRRIDVARAEGNQRRHIARAGNIVGTKHAGFPTNRRYRYQHVVVAALIDSLDHLVE